MDQGQIHQLWAHCSKYYCTPLNTEQVLGQKIRFEKVKHVTDSLQVMPGITFKLKPFYIVNNTLFLKSSAQCGMIRDGKVRSEFCSSICQLSVPHMMLSGKTCTRVWFTCLILTEEDSSAARFSVKHLHALHSGPLGHVLSFEALWLHHCF